MFCVELIVLLVSRCWGRCGMVVVDCVVGMCLWWFFVDGVGCDYIWLGVEFGGGVEVVVIVVGGIVVMCYCW